MENKEENKLIPKINKKISDFLYEEEGNISRGKIITVGSLMLIAGLMFANEVFGAHKSHSSHRSHSSHSSGSGGGHYSHQSHQSHSSHTSSSTHSSHSSSSATTTPASPATTTPTPSATTTVQQPVAEKLPNFQKPQIPPATPTVK